MITRLLIATCLLSVSLASQADRYEGVNLIRGTVFSVGRVDPTENIDTGFFFDANYSSVAFNGGIGTKKFGASPLRKEERSDSDSLAHNERVTNAYLGVGFGRIAQIQYGYGSEKDLLRFRSDFNFRSVLDFLRGERTAKERMTIGDRITFTLAVERYLGSDEDVFNNATWGVGLLF